MFPRYAIFFLFFFLMLLYYRCADGFRSTEMAQIDFLFFSFGEWDFDREISMTIQRMMRDLVNRFIEGSLFWRKIGETSNLFYSYENLYLEREIQGDNCHRGSKRFSRCIYFRRVQSHRDTNFAIARVILNEENGDLNYNCTRRSGIKRASCYNIIATCVSSVLSYRCRVYIRDYINGQLCH